MHITPIDKLMVVAGKCALRSAPVDREICDEIRQVLDLQFELAPDDERPATALLIMAGHGVVAHPASADALCAFQSARDLLARIRAEKARPGTPEAEPSYWWQREGLGG